MRDHSWEECLEELRLGIGDVGFGFRIQGLAAHVLLALGAVVTEVNLSGHPDIVAHHAAHTIRVEVEADTAAHGERRPTGADLLAICPRRAGDQGYFAYLATAWGTTRWLIVQYEHLVVRRNAIPIATIEALSDAVLSGAWTGAMAAIVDRQRDKLWSYSFASLRRRALAGDGL